MARRISSSIKALIIKLAFVIYIKLALLHVQVNFDTTTTKEWQIRKIKLILNYLFPQRLTTVSLVLLNSRDILETIVVKYALDELKMKITDN